MEGAILDRLATHVAVVDEQGVIVAVNQAWRNFAAQNGAPAGKTYEGTNYFAVCDTANGPTSEEALPIVVGLRRVLAGAAGWGTTEVPRRMPRTPRRSARA